MPEATIRIQVAEEKRCTSQGSGWTGAADRGRLRQLDRAMPFKWLEDGLALAATRIAKNAVGQRHVTAQALAQALAAERSASPEDPNSPDRMRDRALTPAPLDAAAKAAAAQVRAP